MKVGVGWMVEGAIERYVCLRRSTAVVGGGERDYANSCGLRLELLRYRGSVRGSTRRGCISGIGRIIGAITGSAAALSAHAAQTM